MLTATPISWLVTPQLDVSSCERAAGNLPIASCKLVLSSEEETLPKCFGMPSQFLVHNVVSKIESIINAELASVIYFAYYILYNILQSCACRVC